jgi:2,3-bisphosphoglycerate-dependent phosphoglycerate mutase
MHCGRLILVRHGQSIWNLQNRFTGWVDVSLSRSGEQEAARAAALLADEHFDVAFTSSLLRAQDTLYEILKQNRHCSQYLRVHRHKHDWYEHFTPNEGDQKELKIHVTENLNERYYGDLQGLNKDRVREHFGEEQVHMWRRSWDISPPNGESLEMTSRRVLPWFKAELLPLVRAGRRILVSAHGNSLRALVKHLERMTAEQIVAYELKTGTPHIYDLDADMCIQNKRILG